MEVEGLFAGIAVVIDDRLESEEPGVPRDRIVEIVRLLKREWKLPCYETPGLPPENLWPGLLRSASFVLLDWQLWPPGASEVEAEVAPVRDRFLQRAQEYFVPVFVFTNASEDVVREALPAGASSRAPVFIQSKASLLSGESLDLSVLKTWLERDATVYVLKTWERELQEAKKELFASLYSKKTDWPKVFWKSFEQDDVDPGRALMELINENLRGRMRTSVLEAGSFAGRGDEPTMEELQALIGEASCRSDLPEDEIRCGDLFQTSESRFLLNLRPDCDCVPRDGQRLDRVRLHCIEGQSVDNAELAEQYSRGHFEERVWEYVAFAVCNGRSVRFSFDKLKMKRFAEIRAQRIGRLLHPYLTRVQQRFAWYSQRQGLPRIPEAALGLQ